MKEMDTFFVNCGTKDSSFGNKTLSLPIDF